MSSENLIAEKNEEDIEDINLDELEASLQENLESELKDIESIDEQIKEIGNPDALGKVVLDEVWKQFGNQIGLDMTNETLIQKYDREHPESYDEVGKKVMQDERYKTSKKMMKQKQQEGKLIDGYTNEPIKQNDTLNLDHVESRKEIHDNQRRKQANIPTEDLANKDENLVPTNESLNKSKRDKSIQKMIDTREQRERDLKAQNERAKEKIDRSNMSESEKRVAKNKLDKRLKDKLAADDKLMKEKDKIARKAINKDIAKGVVKETGKKAGIDALKAMAVQALFELSKQLMNALIRFIKARSKTFKTLLDEMKKAIHNFFEKIMSFIKTGTVTLVGTIVSEIFGPIVSTFNKLASMIKQGFRSFIDAIGYLKNKENKDKPISIKTAEIGKIVVGGLVVVGAIFGSDVFEKAIIYVCPVMGEIIIPLLGSLANIIGLFFASVISGIIGAIVINLIDRLIAKKQKENLGAEKVEKYNQVLRTEEKIKKVNIVKLDKHKKKITENINNRHGVAKDIASMAVNNILEDCEEVSKNSKIIEENSKKINDTDIKIDDILDLC